MEAWADGAPAGLAGGLAAVASGAISNVDVWLDGAPVADRGEESEFAAWLWGHAVLLPGAVPVPPPVGSGLLSITCICGVERSRLVYPGWQGHRCLFCWRLWWVRVSADLTSVDVPECTYASERDADAVDPSAPPLAASADPAWSPSVSISAMRYVDGYRYLRQF